jgi:hypothetical protein
MLLLYLDNSFVMSLSNSFQIIPAAIIPAKPALPKVHTMLSIEPTTSPVRNATFDPKITYNIIDKLINLIPTSIAPSAPFFIFSNILTPFIVKHHYVF